MPNILSIVTWLPVVGAIVLLFFNRENKRGIRLFANLWAVVCFLPSLWLLRYDRQMGGIQFIEDYNWIPQIGARYQMGVDGIAIMLVILAALTGVIAIYCSWDYIQERVKEYYVVMLLLQTGIIGVFVSMDLFLFYVFWEVMLVPMYFVIGVWGSENRLYAAIKFFLYTLLGSVVMLLAILKLYFIFPEYMTGSQANQVREAVTRAAEMIAGSNGPMLEMMRHGIDLAANGRGTFNIMALQALGTARLDGQSIIPLGLQIWLFLGFFISFAIKVPMFPFHTWLPDAHTEAPTAGSVVLAGILLKLGTYGFVRFNLPMFPDATKHPSILMAMVWLSIIGIVYGALVAMAQKDWKRLVAYSSVSHMGMIMLGIFALNENGLNGAVLQMINHGISTGALFLLVGVVYERRHTRMISDYGGLSHVMPGFAAVFMIMTMSSIGLPMLNGFIGEFLILRGVFEANKIWAAFAASGIVLGAAYMLWLYQRTMYGPVTNEKNKNLPDLYAREWAYFMPLIILAFWIGIYPKPFLSYFGKPVQTIVQQVQPGYAASSLPVQAQK
ncbi:MAG: NADH-quinone oxidoreductase subunit M [Acidobacteriota bacterium]|nr:NADH-quinone oxidoreductase subunit M [Blastocatellia bacterium]MDW8239506.1 NADH-quinone oxidoreductase subunit M [Acidobacteriota bacterium]